MLVVDRSAALRPGGQRYDCRELSFVIWKLGLSREGFRQGQNLEILGSKLRRVVSSRLKTLELANATGTWSRFAAGFIVDGEDIIFPGVIADRIVEKAVVEEIDFKSAFSMVPQRRVVLDQGIDGVERAAKGRREAEYDAGLDEVFGAVFVGFIGPDDVAFALPHPDTEPAVYVGGVVPKQIAIRGVDIDSRLVSRTDVLVDFVLVGFFEKNDAISRMVFQEIVVDGISGGACPQEDPLIVFPNLTMMQN